METQTAQVQHNKISTWIVDTEDAQVSAINHEYFPYHKNSVSRMEQRLWVLVTKLSDAG